MRKVKGTMEQIEKRVKQGAVSYGVFKESLEAVKRSAPSSGATVGGVATLKKTGISRIFSYMTGASPVISRPVSDVSSLKDNFSSVKEVRVTAHSPQGRPVGEVNVSHNRTRLEQSVMQKSPTQEYRVGAFLGEVMAEIRKAMKVAFAQPSAKTEQFTTTNLGQTNASWLGEDKNPEAHGPSYGACAPV